MFSTKEISRIWSVSYRLTISIKPFSAISFPKISISTDGTISSVQKASWFSWVFSHVKIKVRTSSIEQMEKLWNMLIFAHYEVLISASSAINYTFWIFEHYKLLYALEIVPSVVINGSPDWSHFLKYSWLVLYLNALMQV